MKKLAGQTALVTGASRGLGQAIAVALANAGARVGLTARSADGLHETAAQIAADGGQCFTVAADLGTSDGARAIVQAVEAEGGGLSVLINNAGMIEPLGSFDSVDFDAWANNLNVNVMGTARVTHAVLPWLRRDGGTVVTISSGAAVSSIGGWSAYCTAKAALDRWAMVLDVELAEAGVRSFTFAPGTIETNMQVAIRSTGVGPQRLVRGEVEHLPAQVPAEAVVFLCTPEAVGLAGKHIDIRYPEVRAALGLAPLE